MNSMRPGSLASLGAKSARENPLHYRWQPIKSLLDDRTAIGLDRLVGAMSSFGAEESVVDRIAPTDDELIRVGVENLVANRMIDAPRTNFAYRGQIE